ncbi:MAG: hypothetical protein ACN4GZ_07455 [Acidimicrobiales bacterium]
MQDTATAPEADHSVGTSPLKLVFRAAVGIAVLASFGVWIYALSGVARQPPPDELDSTRGLIEAREAEEAFFELEGLPAFSVRAQPLCEAATDQLGDPSRVGTGPERAAQLRRSNQVLQDMVGSLSRLPMATERDEMLRAAWLADWEVLLADRARYADAVEKDPAAVYTVSRVADEEGLERRLTRFARTNLMLPCGAPADVG